MKKKSTYKERKDLVGLKICGIYAQSVYETPSFNNPNYPPLHGKPVYHISGRDSWGSYKVIDVTVERAEKDMIIPRENEDQ